MKSAKSGSARQKFHGVNKTMGVMDFLKGLFSSKTEDQGVNNIDITESSSVEPAQDMPQATQEPQAPKGGENVGGSDDLNSQE